ncbi:MAG: hypothetical protein E7430_01735 [Ruminococcaceae bacterium]|nr:hypothetical protein [Oscillospiraceae bacterium]
MDQKTYLILQQQCETQRKQLMWTRIIAVFCLVLVVAAVAAGLYLKSKLDGAFDKYDQLAYQLEEILTTLDNSVDELGEIDILTVSENISELSDTLNEVQWQEIADDLSEVSGRLTEIQWQSLAENIDETAITAQESLEKAMQAIDELDIEGLNEAIEELHTVVEPLANIVKRLS